MSDDPVARTRSRVLVSESSNFTRQNTATYNGSCTKSPISLTLPDTTGQRFFKYHHELMDDFVTPRFFRQMKQGRIINNYKKKVETIQEWFPGTEIRTSEVQRYGCTPARWYDYYERNYIGNLDSKAFLQSLVGTPAFIVEPTLSANEQQALRELALTSAYARINANDVMSLVALAESEKTYVGLMSTFKRVLRILGRLYTMLKRGKVAQVRTEANRAWTNKRLRKDFLYLSAQATQFYMEARYGLRPLYYDVMGFMKFFNKPKITKDRLTFRGLQIWEDRNTDVQVRAVPGVYADWYYTAHLNVHRTTMKTVSVRAGVMTKYTDYSHIQGLGIDLLAETAWELIPFSFVIDWFVNVGDLLASWTPNIGFTPLASWVTQETVVTKTVMAGLTDYVDLSNASYRQLRMQADYNAGGTETIITTERIPNPKQPIGLHFNVKLDALKILDLAIILKQMKGVSTLIKTLRV